MLTSVKDQLQTNLAFRNKTLKDSKPEKVLGVTNDNFPKIKFPTHLVNITKKVNSKFKALGRVQKYTATKQKALILSSFTKSIFLLLLINMDVLHKTFYCWTNNIHERGLRLIQQNYTCDFEILIEEANENQFTINA